jgi:hypothetical protein
MKIYGTCTVVLCLSGCTLLPIDEQHGGATIDFFKNSIECEIAAVATNPAYARFQLSKWNEKTSLDLTLVDTIGGDGRAIVPIPNPTLPTIFPAASLSGKFTHSGHIDFAISIPAAIEKYGKVCQGPDPSQSHLGLSAWIAATLDQIQPQDHGGLSYTVDVDVTASVGSRFGFVFSIVNTVDAGFAYSREGQHHLVVTMSEPTPTPPPGPLAVRVVGPVRVVESKPAADQELRLAPQASPARPGPSSSPGARVRAAPQFRARNPALDDPNLNRLLQQQAPVRLAPGTVLR